MSGFAESPLYDDAKAQAAFRASRWYARRASVPAGFTILSVYLDGYAAAQAEFRFLPPGPFPDNPTARALHEHNRARRAEAKLEAAQARIAALVMALAVVQDTLEPILADRSRGFARVPAWAHAKLTWLWGRTKAVLAAGSGAAP
jgi:hypothetical protein